jgi:hypothetical protein
MTSPDFAANIKACHLCPLRQRPCAGKCACIDGTDIIEHAKAGYCPHGEGPRFGTAQRPKSWKVRGLGDVIAAAIPGWVSGPYKRLKTRLTGKGCGCNERQKRLNKAMPTAAGRNASATPRPS